MNILEWCEDNKFWLQYYKNEVRKEKIKNIFFDDLRNFDKNKEREKIEFYNLIYKIKKEYERNN